MNHALGMTWRSRGERAVAALFATSIVLSTALAASPSSGEAAVRAGGDLISVIVRRLPGSGDVATRSIESLGGEVTGELEIIDSLVAQVPAGDLAALAASDGIAEVTPDGSVRLLGGGDDEWEVDDRDAYKGDSDGGDYNADKDLGSMFNTTKATGVQDVWGKKDSRDRPLTGRGVGIALIDSGVVPVDGLATPGRVINGPDLSFESQAPGLAHLDTFGHGTHMAGIIVGRDAAVDGGHEKDVDNFVGVAPDARLLNMKVAGADGATDVSQVIAAIDWVVQHRNDSGMNVRVLNLSFGTESTQSYLLDPLAHAAEVAWRSGIVVVVSAGNNGLDETSLTNPAMDPYVIAVGSADHRDSDKAADDSVSEFTNRGSATRHPDLVAPGRSIVSLRNPGSFVDATNPGGRVVGDAEGRFFRGSGTSQAAAVVSGSAALLLQQRPNLTPDQVKRILMQSANRLPNGDSVAQGAGMLDMKDAIERSTPVFVQSFPVSTGLGSLEAARGGSHVADPEDGTELVGEMDIFGETWDGRTWSTLASQGRTWSGGDWLGRTWSGDSWSGTSWAGRTWSGRTWSGRTWSGRTWSGRTWSDAVWSGRTWSGRTWSDSTWAGRTWSGRTWSGVRWA